MALFAITYDLIKRKDYQTLWDELDDLGAHKALNSFYLLNIKTEDDAQGMVNYLRQFIDDDDRLMVVKFTGKPRFAKALAGTSDWIKKNT